jgi:hypothetical protein
MGRVLHKLGLEFVNASITLSFPVHSRFEGASVMPNAEQVQLNGLREHLALMAVAAFLAVIIGTIVMLLGGLRDILSVS